MVSYRTDSLLAKISLLLQTVTSEDIDGWRENAQLDVAETASKKNDEALPDQTEEAFSFGNNGDTVCSICLQEIGESLPFHNFGG